MTESKPSLPQTNPAVSGRVPRSKRGISLRWLLVVPFLLQVGSTVALVGWLSLRHGQQAVNDLARQLVDKTEHLVGEHLTTYLRTPIKLIALMPMPCAGASFG